jgi:hypothetical protein
LQSFGKRADLVLSDVKSLRWKKMGNVRMEIHSQIWEETKIIQESVGFTGK